MVALAARAEDRPVVWQPPADLPCTLRDIASRLPANTPARDADLITWGHEGSHFLSKSRPGHHGVYVLEGRVRYIPTPPVPTARVFAMVPAEQRGTIYETYRTQGAHAAWRDQPLMVLDEWVAYLRGSQIRKELGWAKRRETEVHCATLANYAAILHRLARDCPDYDCRELTAFCREIDADCRVIISDWDQLTAARFE